MTRDQRIHRDTLLQLYAVRVFSNPYLSPSMLAREARLQGFDFTESDYRSALRYLQDRQLVESRRDPTTGADTYRITADGIDEYNRSFST